MATAQQKSLSSTPITADDVFQIADQRLSGIRADAARATYIGTKMGDLPKVYQSQMPVTDDPAKLQEAEQAIRRQYRTDIETHKALSTVNGGAGMHAAIIGNATRMVADAQRGTTADADAAASAQAVQAGEPADLSKLSPMQLIALGLKQSKPATGRRAMAGKAISLSQLAQANGASNLSPLQKMILARAGG